MDGTTTKEDVRIDKDDADELNREAAEDLERIENEVKREAEQYVEAAAAEVGIDQGTPAAPPIQFGGQHGRHRAGAESAADGCDRDQIGAQRGGGQRRRTNAPAAADRG